MKNNSAIQPKKGLRALLRGGIVSTLPILCAVMMWTLAFAPAAFAEGSADMKATSAKNYDDVKMINSSTPKSNAYFLETSGFNASGSSQPQQRFKFYADAGETVYLGSSGTTATITGPDSTQTVTFSDANSGKLSANPDKGPNGVYMPEIDADTRQPKSADGIGESHNGIKYGGTAVSDGYNANTVTITSPGVYIVDFKNTAGQDVEHWDITVAQDEGGKKYAVSGRVWMDAFGQGALSNYYGYVFCTTRDGYIYKFGFNGFSPASFGLASNSRGLIKKSDNTSAYHSVHTPLRNSTGGYDNLQDKNGNDVGLLIQNPDNETTELDAPNHMFLNYPSKDLPQDILLPNAKQVGSIESVRFDGRRSGAAGQETENVAGYVGTGGYFEVKSENTTSYRVILDMRNMYAKDYHGMTNAADTTIDGSHNDEICLGNGNFIFHNSKDNEWYEIEPEAFDKHGESKITKLTEEKKKSYCIEEAITSWHENDATLGDYKSCGRVMLGNAVNSSADVDRIYWNGRDEWGRILPAGKYFGNSAEAPGRAYAQAKAGEIHIPMSDVEALPNGVSFLLMNPPGNLPDRDKLSTLSKVYYNDQEKSLLYDKSVSIVNIKNGNCDTPNGNKNVSLQLLFNLPHTSTNWNAFKDHTYDGEKKSYLQWYNKPLDKQNLNDFENNFKNMSIDGEQSYEDNGKLTVAAAKYSNDGSDHGIVDIWTHIVSPVEVDIPSSITLDPMSNQKIIQGFVYMDSGKDGNADGKYTPNTYNDTALPGVTVKAYSGSSVSGTPFYTTKTNSDGEYSIPVDNGVEAVTIQVQMEDDYMSNPDTEGKLEGMSLYKVTTGPATGDKVAAAKQKYGNLSSISIQTVNMTEGNSLIKVPEPVGYTTYHNTTAVQIQKKWYPKKDDDPSLSSEFIVRGTIEKDGVKIPVYERDGIVPTRSTNQIITLNDLPETTYYIDNLDGTASQADIKTAEENKVEYTVTEVMDGVEVTPTVQNFRDDPTTEWENVMNKDDDKAEAERMSTMLMHDKDHGGVDLWLFCNRIYTSDLNLTVWEDTNRDGKKDGDENYMQGARVGIEKFSVSTDTDDYSDSVVNSVTVTKEDGSSEAITSGNYIKTENKELTLSGLKTGKYRITIKPPESEDKEEVTKKHTITTWTHDNATYSNKATEPASSHSDNGTITMIITIENGSKNTLRAGYAPVDSKNGGIEISKTVALGVETDQIMQNAIQKGDDDEDNTNGPKEAPDFTFELLLEQPPIIASSPAEDGSITVSAKTFDVDTQTYQGTKDVTFTKLPNGTYEGWWSSGMIALNAGGKIFIPNVPANDKYKVFEYDNSKDTLKSPNGSNTAAEPTFMPKGFSLQEAIGAGKIREGQVPGTGSDLSVNYTNLYLPEPVSAYAGATDSNADAFDKALNITPVVKLTGREADTGDKFKLLLEPVSDAPAFKKGEITVINAQIGQAVSFANDDLATFDKPGEYKYTLRQALPFKDSGVDPLAGVSYDSTEYTLTVTVVHQYAQLAISEVKWDKAGTSIPDPQTGLVFNNTCESDVKVSMQGAQELDTEITGLLDDVFNGKFEYTIEAGNARAKGDSSDKFTKHNKLPKKTNINNAGAKVDFGGITFGSNDAGYDKEHAMIYKYTVKQTAKPDNVDDAAPAQYDIYIAVYKEIVNDNQNGNLKQVVSWGFCNANGELLTDGTGGFTFTNKYETALETTLAALGAELKAKLDIKGEQTLDLDNSAAFKFVLSGTDDASKAALPEAGRIEYTCKAKDTMTDAAAVATESGKLKFTKAGTYIYTLRQIDPNGEKTDLAPIPGVTYDGSVDTVTIDVTADASTGKLSASLQQKIVPIAKLDDANQVVTFTNTYDPDNQSITIIGMKSVTSDDSAVSATDFMNEFSFKIENAGKKVIGQDGGFSDNEGTIDESITVRNNRDNGAAFAVTLDFNTADAEGVTVEKGDATEDKPVIYRYKITEEEPSSPGFSKDYQESGAQKTDYAYVKVYKAVINNVKGVIAMRCNEDGETNYDDDIVITNKYTPESNRDNPFNLAEKLNITKTVSKQTQDASGYENGTFDFEIQRMSVVDGVNQGDGTNWIANATVDEFDNPVTVDGFTPKANSHKRQLNSLVYDKPAEYQYVIFENKPEQNAVDGMVYSGERYIVSVSVTDKDTDTGKPTGKLVAAITNVTKTNDGSNYNPIQRGDDGKYPVSFTNQYFGEVPEAVVDVSGLVVLDGSTTMAKDMFEFTFESAGSKPLDKLNSDWSTDVNPMPEGAIDGKLTVKNAADNDPNIDTAEGTVDFRQIAFDKEKAGRLYRYKITQTDTKAEGVLYDEVPEKYVYIRVEQSSVDNTPTVHGRFCNENGDTLEANARPFRFDNKLRLGHLEYDVKTTGGSWTDSMRPVLETNGNFNCTKLGHVHASGEVVALPGVDLSRWAQKNDCALVGWSLEQHQDPVQSKEDEETYLAKEATIPGSGATVVYAVWGVDENHNGKADYREARFTHMYHANATLGGSLPAKSYAQISGDIPKNVEDILLGTDIDFGENEPLQMDVFNADGTKTHYVQVGWSAVPRPAAASADEATQWSIPLDSEGTRHIVNVMNLSAYVIWGVDSDSDGIADYAG